MLLENWLDFEWSVICAMYIDAMRCAIIMSWSVWYWVTFEASLFCSPRFHPFLTQHKHKLIYYRIIMSCVYDSSTLQNDFFLIFIFSKALIFDVKNYNNNVLCTTLLKKLFKASSELWFSVVYFLWIFWNFSGFFVYIDDVF